jgi:branched-chain amino acid transport system permease protein
MLVPAFGEIIRLVLINAEPDRRAERRHRHSPPTLFGIPLTNGENGLAALLGVEFSPRHRIVFLFYRILALALPTKWL